MFDKRESILFGIALILILTGNQIVHAKDINPIFNDKKSCINMSTTSYSLDRLPVIADSTQVFQFSSHNKKGLNNDVSNFLYKDEYDEAVIFDAIGPGCIKNIWGTMISEGTILKFYFDDEDTPRLTVDFLEMFSGKHPLFPTPLSSYERTGRYGDKPFSGNSFVPIPFKKRLRISVDKNGRSIRFYHIIYEKYTFGTCQAVNFVDKSGELNPVAGIPEVLIEACKNQGKDLKNDKGSKILNAEIKEIPLWKNPEAGIAAVNYKGQGSIRRITLDMPANEQILHKIYMFIRFDESDFVQVFAPVGMLIANAVHPQKVNSLPIVVESPNLGRFKAHILFPMPFWESFAIGFGNDIAFGQLDNKTLSQAIDVEVAVSEKPYPRQNTGYFATCYRQGQTTYGEDWLLGQAFGKGTFIGVVQSMRYQHYCEGDERFYIDGSGSPAFQGTGSEDYYLACFWPNINFNLPFAGCVGDIKLEAGDNDIHTLPCCYYRFHLDAPIPFHSQMEARIEHGGDSDIHSYYESLSFFYINADSDLLLTDIIDVGNSASEKIHSYKSKSSKISTLTAQYEGTYDLVNISDTGRYHTDGYIKFKTAVSPSNKGVRLRRRLDQKEGRNMVEVYIDGKLVGRWYHADENSYKRWNDSDFDIPRQYTSGKETISVTLKLIPNESAGKFSDFRYWIYCKN